MKAIRKIIINQTAIDRAIQMNTQMIMNYANYSTAPQVEVPKPEYGVVQYNFRPHNVQEWFIEPGGDRDIIVNLSYKGEVRLEYDPIVETYLEAIFSV